MAIWYNFGPFVVYSLWSFGIFFPLWYVLTKENPATLLHLYVGGNHGNDANKKLLKRILDSFA
jgi:hypothetical protein